MSAVTTWPKPWRSTSTGCFDRVFRFRSRALRPRWQAIRLKSQCTRSRCLSRSKGIESGCAACGQGFGAQCTSLLRTGGLPSVGAPRIPGCTQPGPQVGRGQRSMHVVAPGGGGCRAWVRPGSQAARSLGHMRSRSQSTASSIRSSRWWRPASPTPLLPRGVVGEPPLLSIQGCQVAVSYIGMFFTRPITWPSGSAKIPMTTSSMTSISGMITLPPMLAALSRYSVTSSTPT